MLQGALPRAAYLGYLDHHQQHQQLAYQEYGQRILAWEAALAEARRLRSPSPLDLTVSRVQAPSTPGTVKTEDEDDLLVVDDPDDSYAQLQRRQQQQWHQLLQTPPQTQPHHHQHHHHHHPMTPPSTPSPPQVPRKRGPTEDHKPPRPKKKHARRLKFDEDTSSPVSGTVILGPDEALVSGDIDPAFNVVEVTEEARAELAKIENKLGPYQCKLCQQMHDDAFQLAQHRCSRIAHVEYRCPECEKRFSCPANLASHRRWHKPRPGQQQQQQMTSQQAESGDISCGHCEAKFTKPAALRKHMAQRHPMAQNDDNNNKDQRLGLALTSLQEEVD